ncbi:C40 family peptidase [Paenibacillus guangzhouensis]|uniref:C40 family peptidase n=1 Tax=Paenibacillus guangzhouensis TaxID=1473112 RepID=UPI0012673F10|nr:C40 family peptidase [Paenibacillus guangzhouensis]
MKKLFKSMIVTLALTMTVSVGSAFAADSKLDKEVNEVIGTRYQSGGTSTSGFDCSGFTMYIFKQFDIKLPHQSRSQYKMGQKVAKSDLQSGDLVFFNTTGKGISHVGIYVGDNKFAHASSKKGITISSLSDSYYVKRYVGATRVTNSDIFDETNDNDGNQDHDDVE